MKTHNTPLPHGATTKTVTNRSSASKLKVKKNHKYIFVLGGVMSGVGKGVTTSSIGLLLEAKGYTVNIVKVDPYLNVDAGTMNPTEHGEVFVLNSGLETDQDMGNYERFLNRDIDASGYMTSGMVYKSVIDRERSLGYRGKCVEAIPDIRDEIINRFIASAAVTGSDITLVEIGGTVGDYQNIMFMEAARVMRIRQPRDVLFIMVSYLPVPGKLGEMKSKPTQNALRQLNSYGIAADFIIARSEQPMDEKRVEKIAVSCGLPNEHVISAPDVDSIYDIPQNFEKRQISRLILRQLGLKDKPAKLEAWNTFVKQSKASKNSKKIVKIAVIGKYFDSGDFTLADSYLSVLEAIKFSAYKIGVKAEISWINAKQFENNDHTKAVSQTEVKKVLGTYDGIIVPGGFGDKGIEGKLAVIQYAREQKVPYFGLCYGMQLLVIEYMRNVIGQKGAHTAEINPKAIPCVIDIMPDQKKKLAEGNFGGSMRLGGYTAHIKDKTIARACYKANEIIERHRHRYEVNPEYKDMIEKAGLVFSGVSPDGNLAEIAELPQTKHPFFLATQFHPEFLARPLDPHPLFTEFLKVTTSKQSRRK